MIPEVDEALRSLVRGGVGTDIDVAFDAPTKDWAARRNAPTVNLYLYDLTEDVERRPSGLVDQRDPDTGAVVARRAAPRFFKLSYLVTAWTQRPEDEHRLLDGLLSTLLGYAALPPDLLTGSLADFGEAIRVTVGLPPPEGRAFADVWSALGGELKPSLDLVAFAPLWAGQSHPAGPPVQERLLLDATDLVGGGGDRRRQQHVAPPRAAEGDDGLRAVGKPRARG